MRKSVREGRCLMNQLSLSRMGWVVLILLSGFISAACSFTSIIQRIFYTERVVVPADPSLDHKPFEGDYFCQEIHGQTFYGSLGMPSEPALDEPSLDNEELNFRIGLERGDDRSEVVYDLQYTYSARLLIPETWYENGDIVKVEQHPLNYTAKTKTISSGALDDAGWFAGSWIEAKHTDYSGEGGLGGDVEYTWEFIGIVDFDGQATRIQLCSWYQPPDLEVAKAAGSAGFAAFCTDWNYFTCFMVAP